MEELNKMNNIKYRLCYIFSVTHMACIIEVSLRSDSMPKLAVLLIIYTVITHTTVRY